MSSTHFALDEINDTVVRSERGELAGGSDTPFVYRAHTTAGDMWRTPTRLLLKLHFAAGVWQTETKTWIVFQRAKIEIWECLSEDHRTTRATSRAALEHGST